MTRQWRSYLEMLWYAMKNRINTVVPLEVSTMKIIENWVQETKSDGIKKEPGIN